MEVKIGGILPLSTVDYPGKSASVIFFGGCNFRCPYCYTHNLLDSRALPSKEIETIFDLVVQENELVDAIVFTGGEPTCQEQALYELAHMFKSAGLAVKIETNGSNAGILADMFARKLVDYVALDIKAPLEKEREYKHVTGTDAARHIKNIREIMKLKRIFPFVLECRTTIVPDLIFRPHDIEDIAKEIAPYADLYVLQQFTPERGCFDKKLAKTKSPARDELMELARNAKKHIEDVRVRTDEGEEMV